MTKRERYTAHQRKYEQTEKGRACKRRYNERRIWLNRWRNIGVATTAEQARAINAHIKVRKRELIARQSSGTKTQSV
jgi:hypothetical protein